MSDPTQQAAEDGVREVAAQMGVKDMPAGQVQAIAAAFLGLMNVATNSTWKGIVAEANAAAATITTDAEAAEELGQ